ncbi:MAG: transposase [SAR324 cluster bacterium]|nr:transposase [SAR324 cluster bacterium]
MKLKHLYDLGDETVIKSWLRDPYFQYFSGEETFQWKLPVDPTALPYFRKRIGKKGNRKNISGFDFNSQRFRTGKRSYH